MALRTLVSLSLLSLSLAAPASAQVAFQDHPSQPSQQERVYAEGLSEVLGRAVNDLRRVQLAYTLQQLPPLHGLRGVSPKASRKGRGLCLEVGGLRVARARFPTRGEAYAFCALQGPGGEPLLVEARGKQVVILRGAVLRQPRLLARLRIAAWSKLRCDPGTQTSLAFYLADTQFVVDSGAKSLGLPAPADESVDGLLKEGTTSEYTGWIALSVSNKRHHGYATRDRQSGLRRMWVSPTGVDSTTLAACYEVITKGSLALAKK